MRRASMAHSSPSKGLRGPRERSGCPRTRPAVHPEHSGRARHLYVEHHRTSHAQDVDVSALSALSLGWGRGNEPERITVATGWVA